ncbi:MAG: hypothetical protein ACI845_003833 [Gammaproteobacteria bacterium]|jgi:uncharacterized protein (DUF924 family)
MIDDLLNFWFSDPSKKRWFNSTKQFDNEIHQKYGALWQQGRDSQLDHWQDSAEGCLALIILFDQLPLNMFRGKTDSFATEALSRDVARIAIQQGFDKKLPPEQQSFVYMPFMHSELPVDQDLSVQYFSGTGLEGSLRFARHHREIVQKFGRFPHRNEILGRVSSEDELAYLNSKEGFQG